MEKKKIKKWQVSLGILILAVILITVTALILKNSLTPEETLSKFMYLIENKQYEEAKKLCSKPLENLDVLSSIKPNDLTFDFAEDKKSAISTILEDEIEVTNMHIEMDNTLLGWRIKGYEIIIDLIEPQVIEDRIKQNKIVSDIQLMYWAESDIATKDEIVEYAKDNLMVVIIFAETMKEQKYDKANQLYTVISEQDLNIERLKEYNWENYDIVDNFEIMKSPNGGFSSVTVKLEEKKLWLYVAGKQITSIREATI